MKIEWPKKLVFSKDEVSILMIMGLGEMWCMFCGPNTAYIQQTIIEQAINTYNVADMTVVIDGCIIECTP